MLFWLDGRRNTRGVRRDFAREVMECSRLHRPVRESTFTPARAFHRLEPQRIGEGRDPLGLVSVPPFNGGIRNERETFTFPIYPADRKTIPARDASAGRQMELLPSALARIRNPAAAAQRCVVFPHEVRAPEVFISRIAKVDTTAMAIVAVVRGSFVAGIRSGDSHFARFSWPVGSSLAR